MPASEVHRIRARAGAGACALALLGALLVAGCSDAPGAGDLPAVPEPDWGSLDPAVAGELRAAQEALDADVAAGPLDAALGRRFGAQARRYETYELRDAALACYAVAQRLAPDEARWPYLQARQHRTWGELQPAARQLRRTLELDPDYLPAHVALGEVLTEQADLDAAQEALDRALEIDPACAAALFALGEVASAREDWNVAIANYESALRKAPEASIIHYPLGLAYRARGDDERAQVWISNRGNTPVPLDDPLAEASDGVAPSGARADATRASVALREGRFGEAERLYRAVVEADPGDVGARLNLAATLIQLRDLDGARGEYESILRLEPDHPQARTGRGWLLGREGRDVEAVDDLMAALAVEPDLLVAHLYLADTLSRMGVFDQAPCTSRASSRSIRASGGRATARASPSSGWDSGPTRSRRSSAMWPPCPRSSRCRTVSRGCSAARRDDALRDGPRALDIAKALVVAEQRPENLEVFAMALAEVGRHAEAADVQRPLLRTATPDSAERLVENLARYEAGEACLRAWPEVDPVVGAEPLDFTPAGG